MAITDSPRGRSALRYSVLAAILSLGAGGLLRGSPQADSVAEDADLRLRESIRALLVNGGTEIPPEMPASARAIVKDYDQRAEEIRREAASEIRACRLQAMRRLKELQDTHTRAAQLDEAVAIRDSIRRMIEASFVAIENPGTMNAYADQIGHSFLIRVTGRTGGSIYGTAYYTCDSDIATACVHSGILREGETGVVIVTMISAEEPHVGTIRHGVQSRDYGVYPSSYTVRRWKPSLEEIELGSLRLE